VAYPWSQRCSESAARGRIFNAVTLLAVIEHLSPSSLLELLRECHRVLAPDGLVVLTTRASSSDGPLRPWPRSP